MDEFEDFAAHMESDGSIWFPSAPSVPAEPVESDCE